jgi:hypothetical protein
MVVNLIFAQSSKPELVRRHNCNEGDDSGRRMTRELRGRQQYLLDRELRGDLQSILARLSSSRWKNFTTSSLPPLKGLLKVRTNLQATPMVRTFERLYGIPRQVYLWHLVAQRRST